MSKSLNSFLYGFCSFDATVTFTAYTDDIQLNEREQQK